MALGPAEYRTVVWGYILGNHKLAGANVPRIFVEVALDEANRTQQDRDRVLEFVDGAIAGYMGNLVLDPPRLCEGFDALHQDAWMEGLKWGEQKWYEQNEWEDLPTYDEFKAGLDAPDEDDMDYDDEFYDEETELNV